MIYKYFLPLHRLPFHFVDDFFCCADAVIVVPLTYFCFSCLCLGVLSKKLLPGPMSRNFITMFSFRNFTVLGITFKSLINFKLIFTSGRRVQIHLYVFTQFSHCHLLKRLSFHYWVFLALLSNVNWLYLFWGLFRGFCSICVSIFMQVPYCFNYYSFVV